ncbi:MAG TPA: L-threonylcarbamoyladenylate synthase [Acidobacteriota bacterium]|nr:L-threonylcarbamoyladenylate synthase [Acidobacteriota bacterium]
MKTQVLKVGGDPLHDEAVARAAELLRRGQVVAFPTETVYGLGGDATSAEAVEKIFQAKQRPADNPLIVHVAEAEQLEGLVEQGAGRVLRRARRLAEAFWPGPLTLVVPARPALRRSCCRGLDTVAVRLPDHEVARALIRRAGRPLAAPSANLSGRPSPTSAAHVAHDLGGRIPLILDAGPCRVGLESTVLDISGQEVSLLRPGAISASQIAERLGEPVESQGASERSPGTRHHHYRPQAPLYLLPSEMSTSAALQAVERLLEEASKETAAWAADSGSATSQDARPDRQREDQRQAGPSSRQVSFGYWGRRSDLRRHPRALVQPVRGSLEQQARHLYADLRALDAARPAFIVADEPSSGGLADPLRDRLSRAAQGVLKS